MESKESQSLHVEYYGEGEKTIVFIPGLGGTIRCWSHGIGPLAERHRKQVENLVLIGMPYFGSEEAAYRYLRSGEVKWGFLYTNVLLVMIACILTRRIFGWLLPYVRRDIPREVAEDLVKHTWRSSTSSLWEVVYRYDAANELRRLSEQTQILMIHGQGDDIAPFAAIKQLAVEQPDWTLIALEGFDHHPFLRTPHTCLTHIDSLLSGDQRGVAED